MTTENIILSNLIYNDDYRVTVLPHIKDDYFQDRTFHWAFKIVRDYVNKYNKSPTKDILLTDLNIRHDIGETECRDTAAFIKEHLKENPQPLPWLLDSTEKWCQDKAMFNAVYASIDILEKKNDGSKRTSIPTLLRDALNVS